ncbi:MAG TPA: glycosyltransferase family 2 protein [Solirubrobacteraceae bacterium]|nr:glycosyltransferase family 2 protein [Solirubrobacteraceae bacterium]
MDAEGLTAVVLNWRTPGHAVRAVRALIDTGVAARRIVVVDNASGDGSVERLRRELPDCVLLALDENLGFARANNAAARALPGDAYLFVNSDAFAHGPGSVERLLGALDDPAVGIAVPRLLNPDLTLQPSVMPASTPLPELVRASGLSRLVPNRWQPALGTHWDHSESRRIQSAVGAVMLVRGRAWEDVGGFHERSFMYAEDHDLFRRAAGAGWRARFVAEAEFVHLGGASAQGRWDDPQRAERVARAEAAMVRDHLGPVRARLTLGFMAAGMAARAAFHRVRGDRERAAAQRAWLRGYLDRGRG